MKILIIGDSCTDIYIYGSCNRLCPEGPVPILLEYSHESFMGMAGNVYKNLCSFFTEKEIDFVTNNFKLMEKVRFVDKKTNQMLLRLDTNDKCDKITDDILDAIPDYDAVLVSDYCKGFLSGEDVIKLARKGKVSFLDSKRKMTKEIVDAFSYIKLNELEYENNREIVDLHKKKFVVTRGPNGIFWNGLTLPAPGDVKVSSVSGAGDVFFVAFAYHMIIGGSEVVDAVQFAQECCTVAIQNKGTCVYATNLD